MELEKNKPSRIHRPYRDNDDDDDDDDERMLLKFDPRFRRRYL